MTLDSKVRARNSSSHEGERVIANHFGTGRLARKHAARNYPQVNSRECDVNN
jgi:hypothetical protein